MNILMETHIEELAEIEDLDWYWNIPFPEFQENPFKKLEAQLSAGRKG